MSRQMTPAGSPSKASSRLAIHRCKEDVRLPGNSNDDLGDDLSLDLSLLHLLVRMLFFLYLQEIHKLWKTTFPCLWVISVGRTTRDNSSASSSTANISHPTACQHSSNTVSPTFLQNLGRQYYDSHECVRFHDPTDLFLFCDLLNFTFYFKGLFEYFEDFVAQINAPQLDCLRIEYLVQQEVTDFQIPQFIRADLYIEPYTIVIELVHRCQSSLYLSVQQEAIGQVVSQISAMHSNVDRLFISSDFDDIGDSLSIRWLELVRPFPSVKALSVDYGLSWYIPLALKNIAEESAAEVLPALELLHLENQSANAVQKFVAARQNMGRPVTFVNEEKVFKERLNTFDVGE
ncbi:hypothetical protein EDB83DRAFT_2593960 [Lactarius deliciosus]|nr:hypothetical protein EDB83DRAFT_2593960 [Lactarius deliciosus]